MFAGLTAGAGPMTSVLAQGFLFGCDKSNCDLQMAQSGVRGSRQPTIRVWCEGAFDGKPEPGTVPNVLEWGQRGELIPVGAGSLSLSVCCKEVPKQINGRVAQQLCLLQPHVS